MSDQGAEPLQPGERGAFGRLRRKANPRGLVLVYVPALASVLERAHQVKGSALSSQEVARIRAGAPAVAMTEEAARAVWEQRGGV